MRRYLPLVALLSRFGAAGVLNTAVGLSVIAALDLGFGADPHLANAAGYGAGLCTGFVLNRRFVFKSDGHLGVTGAKYLTTMAFAFMVNQAVLAAAGAVLGEAPAMRMAAQLAAMASYTVLQFLMLRAWVFRGEAALAAAGAAPPPADTTARTRSPAG